MAFLIVLAAALSLRLALTLTHEGHLGVDGGAYLLSVNAVLGDEPTGAGFPRPPLAPGWLLVPFVEVFGTGVGYKVWASVASLAPAVPVYLFARRIGGSGLSCSPALPLFAAGFVLLDLLHGEMVVTGALPLLAFGLLGTVWWAMAELVDRWSWRKALVLAVCLGLIPWVNQTTAGLAVVTIPVYAAALGWFHRDDLLRSPFERLSRLMFPLAIGGVIALGALPWYLEVLPVTGMLAYPGAIIYLTNWADSAWWQLIIAWPLGIWIIRKAEAPWLQSLGVLVLLLGTLLAFLSTDETVINIFYRSRYLLAIPFYVGISWLVYTRWLKRFPWPQAAVGLGALAAAAMLLGYVTQFQRQSEYSDMATPATTHALAYLQKTDPEAGIINNSFTLALWVSALNKVPSPHTWTWQPPPRFTETDKDVRCVLGWTLGCDVASAKERLGVGYVLVDTRFPKYNERAPNIYKAPEDPWAATARTPWLTQVFSEGTTIVWRIDG